MILSICLVARVIPMLTHVNIQCLVQLITLHKWRSDVIHSKPLRYLLTMDDQLNEPPQWQKQLGHHILFHL